MRRARAERDPALAPAKSLGQHFLQDANAIRRIVEAAELTGAETVIEVGPGPGALTEGLAEGAGRLILVELDRRMAQHLRERFAGVDKVSVIESDALALAPSAMLAQAALPPDAPYVLVSNLPYNAGAAIVRHFLEAENPPRRLVIMLQREVAALMTAAPGDLGLLGIGVQVYAEARRLFNVAPGSFYPPPKVVSTVLRLDLREEALVPAEERARFFEVVRAGFSAPRKQLRNSLAQGLIRDASELVGAIEAAGIAAAARPETLSIDQWLRLTRALEAA